MNRKLKALGLALVAALALTAVMASTASAQFTSNKQHTTLSGNQVGNHSFSAGTGFGAITCTTATFSGTSSVLNDTKQIMKPTYSGCKDSLGRTVDPENNTLVYEFTKTGTEGETPTGTVHVTGSIELVVTSSGKAVCTVTIVSPQTNNGITYHNKAATEVLVTTAATNVKSTVEGGFFNCGTSTTNATAGTYNGETIVKGTGGDGLPANISVDK